MQNRFLCRVWNKCTKKYLDEKSLNMISYKLTGYKIYNPTMLLGLLQYLKEKKDNRVQSILNNLIFEQYVGVNDKQKQPICEGDIIFFDVGNETWNDVVIYDKDDKCFRFRDSWSEITDASIGEINGNIHENSELLK